VFLVEPSSRVPVVRREPAIFPLGVGSSPECCELRLRPPRPSSGPRGSASPEVLAPSDTTTSGAPSPSRTPFVAREGRGSPDPRRCRPQGSCPSRRFQLARGSRRGPRRFAVLLHTARVPGAPLQSFPFPGSRTRSRGPLLPCGFAFRLPPAQSLRDLHGRFPLTRAGSLPRARPKADPGLMSRDEGSLRSLVRPPRHTEVCRTYRPLPTDTGLAGKRPTRPLRSFAPPGSPFSDDPNTWPGWNRPSVLSWGSFALQSSLHHGSEFGVSRRHTRGAKPLATCASGRPAVAVAFRDPDSDA